MKKQGCLNESILGRLTKQNLRLRYMELDTRGRVDQLADSHDLAEVQAVSEDDLRLATEQLKRSTENMTKQTETLRQQGVALSRLVKQQVEDNARRQELDRLQKRKKEVERSKLKREVREGPQLPMLIDPRPS